MLREVVMFLYQPPLFYHNNMKTIMILYAERLRVCETNGSILLIYETVNGLFVVLFPRRPNVVLHMKNPSFQGY